MLLKDLSVAALVLLLSFWLTKQLARFSFGLRLLDHPNERSLHAMPTPRTGGLAVLASLSLGICVEQFGALAWKAPGGVITRESFWALGSSLLIALVSFLDDWAKLPSGVRFLVHLLAAAGVIFGAGLTINEVGIPFAGSLSLRFLALPLTLLWLIWMTNLYNFMDGMDGFAGGMSVCGFGVLGYLGYAGGHHTLGTIATLTAAGSAGFLWHNLPPAKIFMGDIGSTMLGFLAGALSIMGIHDQVFEFPVPVLIFAPFIFDATITLLRRLLRGEKLWQAHRKHYYQRLVLSGWGHGKTVTAEYILMFIGGASAIIYNKLVHEQARLILLLGCVSIFAVFFFSVRVIEQRSRVVCAD